MLASADSVQTKVMCVRVRICMCVCVCVYLKQEEWQTLHWGRCMPQILMTGTTRPTLWRQVQPSKSSLLNVYNFFFLFFFPPSENMLISKCAAHLQVPKQDRTGRTANGVKNKRGCGLYFFDKASFLSTQNMPQRYISSSLIRFLGQ